MIGNTMVIVDQGSKAVEQATAWQSGRSRHEHASDHTAWSAGVARIDEVGVGVEHRFVSSQLSTRTGCVVASNEVRATAVLLPTLTRP